MTKQEKIAKQNEIQSQALAAWNIERKGTIEAATGVGKSRIAVLAAKQKVAEKPDARILLLVPTETLRDINWRKEFEDWDAIEIYEEMERECYQSAYKKSGEHYDLVIADEVHNALTENYGQFFENNSWNEIICLSATIEEERLPILNKFSPIVYSYTLKEAVEDGIVSPFSTYVINHTFEERLKNIKGGSKKKPFMQTEDAAYAYRKKRLATLPFKIPLSKQETMRKIWTLERARFMWNLPSKKQPVKALVDRLVANGERVLVFGESTAALDEITPMAIHSNKKDSENQAILEAFNNGDIDVIAAAKKIKEGMNLGSVTAIVMQSYNSRSLDLIQKIGRGVRWEIGKTTKLFVFCTTGSVEESWLERLSEDVDFGAITYHPSRKIGSLKL